MDRYLMVFDLILQKNLAIQLIYKKRIIKIQNENVSLDK